MKLRFDMENKKSKLFNYLRRKAVCGKHFNLFYKILYVIYADLFLGCDIKLRTKIGANFTIYHGARGTVINPHAIIGNNVSVRQNTTIGSKGFSGSVECPEIGDNVTIGPNVCIIGHVTIGNGSVIGAGAVVVKNVPPYAVVAGNPAKVIKMLKSDLGGGKLIRNDFYRYAA